MKKLHLIAMLAIGFTQLLFAQTACYTFDDIAVPTGNKAHAFNVYGNGNAGFLQDWNVTSGTPSIYASGDIAGVTAYQGNQYALMTICDAGATWSEGASLSGTFTSGQTYTVSMAIRNAPFSTSPTPIDIEYVLLQNPISYTYNTSTGCSPTPSIPGGGLTVHTISGFAQNSWQNVSFNISNLTGTYSQLWIRAKFSSGSPLVTTFLCLDSMCIQQGTTPPAAGCYSFDDVTVPANDKQHAFNVYGNGNAGFLSDWSVPSGTPSIYASGDLSGVNAYQGNQYALLTICDAGATSSEGISLAKSFTSGQNYTVSMAIRNAPYLSNPSTPIDIEFVLLQSPIAYTYNSGTGCSNTPSIPGGSLVAHTITGFSQNSWQPISFNVTGLTGTYSQLWVRAKFSSGAPLTTTFLCLDSMCVQSTPVQPQTGCYSFDETTVPSNNKQHAYNVYGNGNAGFLSDWNVVSGTPSIYASGDLSGVNAFQGNQYSLLTICDAGATWSEGVSLNKSFVQGGNYTVSMAIRNAPYLSNPSTPVDVEFVLLQSPIAYTYNSGTGCSNTPVIPGNALVVHTITGFAQNAWQPLTFNIGGLGANYSQLWIRAKFSSGSPLTTTFFCFDDFCVQNAACDTNTLAVSINASDLTCTNPVDTATLNLSGGTAPYSYNWNTGSTDSTIVIQNSGVYTVWVTDSNGCVKTASDTVLNNAMSISLQAAGPVSCNGVNDGEIDVLVNGGMSPFTYAWSNGGITDSIAGLAAGTYTLTVTDVNSCTATFSYQVTQAATSWSYYVYTNTVTANCTNNGSAKATASGGVAPYTYLWNTVPPQTTQTATGLAPGVYSVTVTGANGCSRTGTAAVGTSCKNVINGFAFYDANGNCQKDSGEVILTGISVTATNGTNTYYGNTNSSGFFSINCAAPGTFTVTAIQNGGYSNCPNANVCGAQSTVFPSLGDTTSLNFGFAASGGFDLRIQPTWNIANPGFAKTYSIRYYQTSQPLYNGQATIVFEYDSILLYQSCTQGGVHDPFAHTITWTVGSVPFPTWNTATTPFAYFVVPVTTPISYPLRQEFWIYPTQGDCDTLDNHLLTIQPVTGSFDPNMKEVSPAGDIVEEDSVLTYTIHFQNTGNDTTWFVILKDTLSASLEPASVMNLASSHTYSTFDVSDNGVLTWEFNPIYLVDSATNEAASKGFVMFKVKKKANLPVNTVISNSAGIYFDYNEPIITNTVTSKVTEPNGVFAISRDTRIGVTAMPNPFTQATVISVDGTDGVFDFELVDINGKMLKKITANGFTSFEIQREGMAAGVYFYAVTTKDKQRAFGKLIVQ